LAELPEQLIGIDPGIVSVAPFELQRISPHGFDILQYDQQWYIIRFEPALPRPFIHTCGTRAMLSEEADRIDRTVAVTPFDP